MIFVFSSSSFGSSPLKLINAGVAQKCQFLFKKQSENPLLEFDPKLNFLIIHYKESNNLCYRCLRTVLCSAMVFGALGICIFIANTIYNGIWIF